MKYKPRKQKDCDSIVFHFPFKIEPKQSARFVGKRVLKAAKVRDFENKVKDSAKSQLEGRPYKLTGAIQYTATYYYKIIDSHYKWAKDAVKEGHTVLKETQPDLTDNLNKGIVDALAPLIMANDGQIAVVSVKKVWAKEDAIVCSFKELPNPF